MVLQSRINSGMSRVIRIGLAQINPVVGDLHGNTRLIADRIAEARDQGVDIVCFPELALTGYPPEDLVLKPQFVRDNIKALDAVMGLRVAEEDEVQGLDLTQHSEVAYSLGGSEAGEYVALSGGHGHGTASSSVTTPKVLASTRR